MVNCYTCGSSSRGVYRDNDGNPLCAGCVAPNVRKQRTKNMCHLCEQRQVFKNDSLGLCCRCESLYERHKDKRLCSECSVILRHNFSWTDKCCNCYDPDNPRSFINKAQNSIRSAKKQGTA